MQYVIYLLIHKRLLLWLQGKMALTPDEQQVVDKVVKQTMNDIMKFDSKHYEKLVENPDRMESVMNAAKGVAEEQVPLAKHFVYEPSNIEEILSQHLPEERIALLKKGLSIPTFRMEITKRLDDDKHVAAFTRNNINLLQPRILNSNISIDWAKIKQYGSIVVEAVLLVLSAVGISVTPGEHSIEQAVDEVAHIIQTSSKFKEEIQKFIEVWDTAGSGAYQKAKAIFHLIKDTYSSSILWTLIKSICSNMKWYEWLETAAKVSAMIIAALATEGIALIGEIALVVLSAVDFAKKIANIGHLNNIKHEIL